MRSTFVCVKQVGGKEAGVKLPGSLACQVLLCNVHSSPDEKHG